MWRKRGNSSSEMINHCSTVSVWTSPSGEEWRLWPLQVIWGEKTETAGLTCFKWFHLVSADCNQCGKSVTVVVWNSCKVTVTLTFDQQNLIYWQFWRNLLEAFTWMGKTKLRIVCVIKLKPVLFLTQMRSSSALYFLLSPYNYTSVNHIWRISPR